MSTFTGSILRVATNPPVVPSTFYYDTSSMKFFSYTEFTNSNYLALAQNTNVKMVVFNPANLGMTIITTNAVSNSGPDVNGDILTTWTVASTQYFFGNDPIGTDACPVGGLYNVTIYPNPSSGGGSGTVTSITATSPVIVTPNPLTSTGVVSLSATTSAGSYTNANITVDGFGRVTTASNGSSSGTAMDFYAVNSTTQTIPAATNNAILTFPATNYNDGGLFVTGSNEALATVAGIYSFSLLVKFQNPSPTSVAINLVSSNYGVFAQYLLNPNAISESVLNQCTLTLAGTIKMNVNDTIQAQISNDGGSALSVIQTQFSGSLV